MVYNMRTSSDFDFVEALFNRAEQTNEEVNNLQVNAYQIRINGNIASIEAICANEYGCHYGTNDIRVIKPSKKQLDRLLRLSDFRLGVNFFVYG